MLKNSKNMEKNFWKIGFPSIFMLIGLGVLYFGIQEYFTAKESESWGYTNAIIVKSEVKKEVTREISTSSRVGGESITYKADIEYKYELDGISYRGNRVSYGETSTGDPKDAQKIVDKYPKDKMVYLYVSPNDPKEVVIENGISNGVYFLPIFGLVFFLIGLGMFLAMRKWGFRS